MIIIHIIILLIIMIYGIVLMTFLWIFIRIDFT